MQTCSHCTVAPPARDQLIAALADLDADISRRFSESTRPPKRRIKPLVLAAVPDARVCRIAPAQFACYIGEHRLRMPGACCSRGHSTADLAWLCLARYVASADFERRHLAGLPQ